ncbi:MAG TPA: hypothetical protein VIY73_07075 [Polyangiaceae bacterium]
MLVDVADVADEERDVARDTILPCEDAVALPFGRARVVERRRAREPAQEPNQIGHYGLAELRELTGDVKLGQAGRTRLGHRGIVVVGPKREPFVQQQPRVSALVRRQRIHALDETPRRPARNVRIDHRARIQCTQTALEEVLPHVATENVERDPRARVGLAEHAFPVERPERVNECTVHGAGAAHLVCGRNLELPDAGCEVVVAPVGSIPAQLTLPPRDLRRRIPSRVHVRSTRERLLGVCRCKDVEVSVDVARVERERVQSLAADARGELGDGRAQASLQLCLEGSHERALRSLWHRSFVSYPSDRWRRDQRSSLGRLLLDPSSLIDNERYFFLRAPMPERSEKVVV